MSSSERLVPEGLTEGALARTEISLMRERSSRSRGLKKNDIYLER